MFILRLLKIRAGKCLYPFAFACVLLPAVFLTACSGIDTAKLLKSAERATKVLQDLDILIEQHRLEDSATGFDPSRLALVDHLDGVSLFRGKLPELVSDGKPTTFHYDGLIRAMREEVQGKSDVSFPENPSLIVVSLLNNKSDTEKIAMEREFFENNPTKGRLIN